MNDLVPGVAPVRVEDAFVQVWLVDGGCLARDAHGDLLRLSFEGAIDDLGARVSCPPTVATLNCQIPVPEGVKNLVIKVWNPFLTEEDQTVLLQCAKDCLSDSPFFENICILPADVDCGESMGDQGSSTLVVQLFLTPDMEQIQRAEDQALACGAMFCAVIVRFPLLLVGPCADSEHAGLYSQFYKRLVSASLEPLMTHVSLTKPLLDGFASQLDVCLQAIRGMGFGEFANPLSWSSLNLVNGEYENHWLVPWIDWAGYAQGNDFPRLPAQALMDSEVGVVTQLRHIRHNENLPDCLTTVQSDVADIRVISQWANNSVCQGSAINDWQDASNAAVGEAIERYCINILDLPRIIVGSWTALERQGLHPWSPQSFVLFSDEQYARDGFPFERFTKDTIIPWIDGVVLGTGEPVYVPVSMVYVNYNHTGFVDGVSLSNYPLINPVPYAGVAAGSSEYDPIVNGLEEIIERDATMIWWHSKPAIDPVKINSPQVDAVIQEFEAKRFSVKLFILPNEFRIPVVAACLTNEQFETCNIGFSCRPNVEDAALKAVTEAGTLFDGSIDLLDQNGRLYEAIRKRELSEKMALPWRADRHYLDSIDWDFSRVTDLMIQQHINIDPRAKQYRSGHLNRQEHSADLSWLDQSEQRNREYYLERLEAHGYDTICVDVTTPDIRMCGGRVVRVLVPGLVPNFAAGHITLGHRRIQDAYFKMGLLDSPQEFADLNYFPLPHA